MLPTIEAIVEGLLSGEYTKDQTLYWILLHIDQRMELAASDARVLQRARGGDDHTYITSPAACNSDSV